MGTTGKVRGNCSSGVLVAGDLVGFAEMSDMLPAELGMHGISSLPVFCNDQSNCTKCPVWWI